MVKTKKQLNLLTMYILSEDPGEKAELEKQLRCMVSHVEDTKTTIQSVLRDLGVPTRNIGYPYLIRAIEMQMQNPRYKKFTVEVYGGIAKEFGTTGDRVERAMRHCVELAWARGDYDTIQRYFGSTIDPSRGKATLMHFITRIAEAVQEGQDG